MEANGVLFSFRFKDILFQTLAIRDIIILSPTIHYEVKIELFTHIHKHFDQHSGACSIQNPSIVFFPCKQCRADQ